MPVELHLQANTHAELCDKALFALGPNGETLFLGLRFDTELAEKYKVIGRNVYMLGKDGQWRRAAAKTWVKLEPNAEPVAPT